MSTFSLWSLHIYYAYLMIISIKGTLNNNYDIEVVSEGQWGHTNITCYPYEKSQKEISQNSLKSLNKENGEIQTPENVSQEVLLSSQVIQGSQEIHVFSNCDTLVFGKDVIEASVKSLYLSSTGKFIFQSDWFEPNSNLSVLKISPEKGLEGPNHCKWIPPNLKLLDLSHISLDQFMLRDCDVVVQELSIVDIGVHELAICIPNLRYLDASWNEIEDATLEHSCETDNKIAKLKLSHNKLKHWNACNWSSLVHLEVDNNVLEDLQFDNCSGSFLLVLKASHNRLHAIPLSLPTSLEELDLSYNKISSFVTSFGSSLKLLDLSHNRLESIGKDTFSWTWELLSLDLSHNKLTKISGHEFMELRNLRKLSLQFNELDSINHESFLTLHHLEELNIASNKLTELDARLLATLPQNLIFHARHNPWRCNCQLLSSLVQIERYHCLPNCKQNMQTSLKCRIGESWVSSLVIIQQCMQAIREVSELNVNVAASDEDTSEEKKDDIAFMAGPSGIIIILVLIGAAAVAKAYFERELLKKHLRNCLKRREPDEPTNRRTERSRIDDTDSETEL